MLKTFLAIFSLMLFVCRPLAAFAEPVKYLIGASLPLSGRLAEFGEDVRRGLELGAQDFSGSQTRFELKFEDNQHQGPLAATTAQKLINIDKVDVIVSMWDMADVIAPIAEKKKTPHFSIRWDPGVAETHKFTITTESTYRSYVQKTIELFKLQGVKKIGLLTEEAQGWVLAADFLKKLAPQHGLEIVADEKYASSDPPYQTTTTRLLGRKAEMIVLFSNPPHTENFVKTLRELGPTQKLTGYFETAQRLNVLEGVPFAAQFAVAPWFEQKFEDRFGVHVKARASHAYDLIKLLSVALESAASRASGPEIMQQMTKLRDVPGASGKLNLSAERTIENQCVFKIVRNGKFETMASKELKRFLRESSLETESSPKKY